MGKYWKDAALFLPSFLVAVAVLSAVSGNTATVRDKRSDGITQEQQSTQKAAMTEVADGTFKGSAECKVFRYTVQLQVNFKDGYITKIHHLKVKGNRNPANKSFGKRAYWKLKTSIVEEQGVDGVDAVSGATFASDAIKEAYKVAHRKAVTAKEKGEMQEETKKDKGEMQQ